MTKKVKHNSSLLFGIISITLLITFFFILNKINLKKNKEIDALSNSIRTPYSLNADDHIWGTSTSSYILILYSDTECPYCKTMHSDMLKLKAKYEDLAIVYRHNPLTHRFKKSFTESKALECVSKLKGEASFWKYLNNIYSTTKSSDSLEYATLLKPGTETESERLELEKCISTESELDMKIRKDKANASASGVTITPSAVLLLPKTGSVILIEGTTYARVSRIIEALKAKTK